MKPPISPRSADGKPNGYLLKASRSDIIVEGSGVELVAAKLVPDTFDKSSKGVDTRNNEVVVVRKRSMNFHSRIGWPSINKNKTQQRQPHHESSRQQQLNEECREPPPKQAKARRITQTGKKFVKSNSKDDVNPDSKAKNETSKYIPLRQRLREREKRDRDSTARPKSIPDTDRQDKIDTSPRTMKVNATVEKDELNSLCAPREAGSKSLRPETVVCDSVNNESMGVECKSKIDNTCLDTKFALFSEAAHAVLSGVTSAYLTLAEVSQAKFNPVVPMETKNYDTEVHKRMKSCPLQVYGAVCDVRVPNHAGLGHGCCRIDLDEDEPSDEIDCSRSFTNADQESATVGYIVQDLDTKSIEATLKRAESVNDNIVTVPQTPMTANSKRNQKQVVDRSRLLGDIDEYTPEETKKVIHLKRAIAAAQERERFSLTSQRYMEEKISSLQRELDAERKIVIDKEKKLREQAKHMEEKISSLQRELDAEQKIVLDKEEKLREQAKHMEEKISSLQRELDAERKIVLDKEDKLHKQAKHSTNHGKLQEKHSPLHNESETNRILVRQEKELKKSSLLGDLQKRVSQTIERVSSKQANIEAGQEKASVHCQNGSLSEFKFPSLSDKGSALEMETDGNSSISSATGLESSGQGVIRNISLVELSTTTEDDVELELIENTSCLEDTEECSTGSKTDCSSGRVSGLNRSDWRQEILSPGHSGANDESTSRSFTDNDSLESKHAAWRWFRFRPKVILDVEGDESNPTSGDTSFDCTTEDEEGSSNSFNYTQSSENSGSASMDTDTTAEIDYPNTFSYRSDSFHSSSSDIDHDRSLSSTSIEQQMNMSPRKVDKTKSETLSRSDSGFGLLAM